MHITAIFLGLLQGATEFLPVSSSGHLVLAEAFLGVSEAGLAFDIALHMGTLLAILIYFRQDWLAMLTAWLPASAADPARAARRLMLMRIIVATVPAAAAGVLLEDYAAEAFRAPLLVACTLAVFGALLWYADARGRRARGFAAMDMVDALVIGLAQALAIVPGVSRSGVTMTAGLLRGLDRPAAARFSFLMSAPVIGGAGLLNALKIMKTGLAPGQGSFFLTGVVVSALSGYLFIALLMKYIRTRSLAVFAWYRFALAAVVAWTLVL